MYADYRTSKLKLTSYPNIKYSFSLQQGFFMDDEEIKKRVPEKLTSVADSLEMKTVAIWVTDRTTEVFFCEAEPDDETIVRLEQLSQSFMG